MAVELLRKKAASGVTGESSVEDIESVVSAEAALTATSVATSVVSSLVSSHPQVQNTIINGSMDFWQRQTSLSIIGSSGSFVADRWWFLNSGAGTIIRCDRVADSPDAATTYCAEVRVVTPNLSPTGVALFRYPMEGTFYAPLHGGQSVTLSFWVKSNNVGTYAITLQNAANNRTRVELYTVTAPDVWERKIITFPTDSTGTWVTDTNLALRINFSLFTHAASGLSPDTGQWLSGNYISHASASTNFLSFANNYLRITQVMLTKGTGAPAFQRAGGDTTQELRLCQRYYEKSYPPAVLPGTLNSHSRYASFTATSTGSARSVIPFQTPKRGVPNIGIYSYLGTASKLINVSTLADVGTAILSVGSIDLSGYAVVTDSGAGLVSGASYWASWVADSEI